MNGHHLSGDVAEKKSLHTTHVLTSEITPTTAEPSLAWKYDGKVHDKGMFYNLINIM